jgi:hypothetical protein
MPNKKLAELAPAGPQHGMAQSKLVSKYNHIPLYFDVLNSADNSRYSLTNPVINARNVVFEIEDDLKKIKRQPQKNQIKYNLNIFLKLKTDSKRKSKKLNTI